MINEITQSISPITPLPGLLAENRPAAVNILVEQELPQNSIEMQSLVGQVNTFIGQTNTTADEVLANATLASNAAAVAVANANYKGDWVAGFNTTGYSLGMSVTYTDGYNYSSKINNNLTEPTTLQNTTEWNFIEAVNPNNYYLKTETNGLISNVNSKIDTHVSLGGVTAYHLLSGNLSVDATVLTNGFGLYLYTGNTTTPPTINLGMDITSQWGNTADETYGYLIKIKSRSAIGDWTWVNSVRGITKYISSSTTAVEGIDVNMFTLSTVAGVTTLNIGTSTRTNTNGVTYVVEVYQTTHKKTGVTNQGKAFTEHYNPDTGFTINGYEGSGLAGHEIPHSLGRKLGFATFKNLTSIDYWKVATEYGSGFLEQTEALSNSWGASAISSQYGVVLPFFNVLTNDMNYSSQQYIMYGWANSYIDESDKLIGNYEIGVYQGSGASGNKVATRGKPAWVMIKRLDSAGNWWIVDNQRSSFDAALFPMTSGAEVVSDFLDVSSDGFILKGAGTSENASGGQYLYMVIYDNDNGSGKSKYPKASDTANVQINNGIIPLAHGIDSNGSKNSIVVANETITGVTYTEGKNYLYKTDTGYGVKAYEPRYLSSELVRRFAGEQPDYYDVESNKWFNCDTGSAILDYKGDTTTGWTAVGATLSISNDTLVITKSGAAVGYAYRSMATVIGKRYRVPFNFILGTCASVLLKLGTALNTNDLNLVTLTASNVTYIEFVAQSTTTFITLYNNSTTSGQTSIWDNIVAFPTEITPTTEITESRNYMDHIVHADADGGVLYVEELTKIEYKNIIKADEYLGSNAISLSVAFNLTTTPITIKGKMIGAKALIRTGPGIADIYLNDNLKGTELKLDGITNGNEVRVLAITDDKITIETSNSSGTATSYTYTSINGVGE